MFRKNSSTSGEFKKLDTYFFVQTATTHTMPRDIQLFEDITADAVAAINADDTVTIKNKEDIEHFHSTRRLFEILKSKQSDLDVLLGKVTDVTLHVDYWTLYECRDKKLDDKRTREMVMPENSYSVSNEDEARQEYHEPSTTVETKLKTSELRELRHILQRFPNLHVQFSCTIVGQWDSKLICAWIGVIRTFPNISDIDTSWADKYGFMVAEYLDDVASYWGVKPTRILRLRGIDNNFDEGYCNLDARFIAEAESGYFYGGWRKLVEEYDHVNECGSLIRFMAFTRYSVRDSAACAEDFEYGACYFPNVHKLELNLSFEACNTEANGIKVFEIPGMPQLRDLSLSLDEAGGVNRGDTLEIRVGPCPRLVSKYCDSSLKDITVRFVFAPSC